MKDKLYWNTVSEDLREALLIMMRSPLFQRFRLVGGTALSLRMGHRLSVDIDLFTDAAYGSIDFEAIDTFLRENFGYAESNNGMPISFGKSWYIGRDMSTAVKVDIYYTDAYIRPESHFDEVRMATDEDIIAMKLEAITNGGRKKDFWDLHRLHQHYSVNEMISFYKERYPYSSSDTELLDALTRFDKANDDFDPVCLLNKNWEIIKLEITRWVGEVER